MSEYIRGWDIFNTSSWGHYKHETIIADGTKFIGALPEEWVPYWDAGDKTIISGNVPPAPTLLSIF